MNHAEALQWLRDYFRRGETQQTSVFSGPTLTEQEPDLQREIARSTASVSGWAAGGHPSD